MAANSYGQIFKSTALTGGASIFNILLGVVRTKLLAILLGTSGVGLLGLYAPVVAFASTLAGMGLGNSGVRQIAEAAGGGDPEGIAQTIKTVRRTALVLGVAGAFLLAVFSHPISVLTFGNGAHAGAVAVLGLAVLFTAVTNGEVNLIQGLRRIGDLARLNVLGALTGTVIGLPLIWIWRERGIVPLLVLLPAAAFLFAWGFARRVPLAPVRQTWPQTLQGSRALLGLGMAFVASGLMTSAVDWVTRALILRQWGLEAAGCYSASYTLAAIYAGFIFQAMGADFFPRITAVARDHVTVNRLVNEQSEIALLLAVPGILGTLVLAPWIIRTLYERSFDPAVPVLQWQVLGVLGRVISWPVGFILLAQGKGKLFLFSEFLANSLQVLLVWFLVPRFGLEGAGAAFAAMYLWVAAFVLFLTRRLTGFRWSELNLQMLAWTVPLMTAVFVAMRRLPPAWGLTFGLAATAVTSWVCFKGLIRRVPPHRLGRMGFLARWAQ